MKIFVAGATGVLGIRIVPLLVERGHEVLAMTRSPAKADALRSLGAQPLVCDVFDAPLLRTSVRRFAPELVIDELTDLADDAAKIDPATTARIRTEGTRNLLDAVGGARVLTQSVAWQLGGEGGRAVAEHERLVLEREGVVIRYGQLYGPGTYHETPPADGPRIHIDDAARRTLEAMDAPAGAIVTLVE